MKCPHCDKSISVFSRAVNRFEKGRTCPYCMQPVRLFVSFKVIALLFMPVLLLGVLLKPFSASLGISWSLIVGLCTGVLVMSAMRLRAA